MHMISDDVLFNYGRTRAKITNVIARVFSIGCCGCFTYDVPKVIQILAGDAVQSETDNIENTEIVISKQPMVSLTDKY